MTALLAILLAANVAMVLQTTLIHPLLMGLVSALGARGNVSIDLLFVMALYIACYLPLTKATLVLAMFAVLQEVYCPLGNVMGYLLQFGGLYAGLVLLRKKVFLRGDSPLVPLFGSFVYLGLGVLPHLSSPNSAVYLDKILRYGPLFSLASVLCYPIVSLLLDGLVVFGLGRRARKMD